MMLEYDAKVSRTNDANLRDRDVYVKVNPATGFVNVIDKRDSMCMTFDVSDRLFASAVVAGSIYMSDKKHVISITMKNNIDVRKFKDVLDCMVYISKEEARQAERRQ